MLAFIEVLITLVYQLNCMAAVLDGIKQLPGLAVVCCEQIFVNEHASEYHRKSEV
jgi:hypothetical protein